MSNSKLITREETKLEYTWAIEDIFTTDEEWEKEYKLLSEKSKELSGFEGCLNESADKLLSVFKLKDQLNKLYERVVVYANQRLHENMANSKYLEMVSKAQNLSVEFSQLAAFIEPEIIEIDTNKLKKFIEENDELKQYELAINRILRRKEHTLSKIEEEIIAKTYDISSAPDDIFSMFNDADANFGTIKDEKGKEIELTHGRYSKFMESKNREVRKSAFQTLYKEYMSHKNTLASLYMANLKQMKFYADIRKYKTSRQMVLDENYIPEKVYDSLIEAVHKYIPTMYKYVDIRRKALGIEELHMYDVYTPITNNYEMKVSFEEAKEIVKSALEPMGEEYISNLQAGFDNRWIDVYENQGKRSGAYSWGPYGTHPYVLLNYQNNLNNVFTLAHEMGHALHSYYSDKIQPYQYASYKIFVAEVASTCNESLLIHYLLNKCEDKEEKIYLLNYFIDQFKGTVFRQTMFAEFEKITHEKVGNGEGLTAEGLCEIYLNLNKLYFGENMISDEEIAMEWSRIPHFYTPFYVYQYATGFSAAISLSKRIMEFGEEAVNDYMKFLTGGSSKEPIELLKLAGVDMNTSTPVEEALELFVKLVDELDSLI